MTTPGWTPEDAEALRHLQERQAAAAQPAAAPEETAASGIPAADEVADVPEAEVPHPADHLAGEDAAFEPAGAAGFQAEAAGGDDAGDGAGDVVPAPEPAGAGASESAAAAETIAPVDDGPAMVGEPGAGPADQGPAESVEIGPDDAPDAGMTAAEAQQSLSAAGATALPDFMQVSQAEPGAGEPALPDSATGN